MSDMVPAKKVRRSVSAPAAFVNQKPIAQEEEPLTAPLRLVQDDDGDDSSEEDVFTMKRNSYLEYNLDDEEPSTYFRNSVTPRRSGGCLLWSVITLAIIGLVIGVGGLFAHADVVLVPRVWTGPVDAFVTLSQVRMQKTVMMGTATKTFTQEEIVPAVSVSAQESPATGIVRFYNAGTSPRTLENGTTIIAARTGAAYAVTKAVSLPAAKGKIPSQVDVAVNSIKTGTDQNDGLDDFSFSSTRMKDFPLVTIHGVTPLAGGSGLKDAVADPTALADAEARVTASFADTETLVRRMSEELPADTIVIPIPFPAAAPSVVTEASHPDGVHVIAREAVTVMLVSRTDIAAALAGDLSVPAGVPVTLDSFDGLTVTTDDRVAGSNAPQQVHVRITGTGTLKGVARTGVSTAQLAGDTRKQIRDVFTQNPAIASVDIHMTPFWRRILPLDASKISIKVK